jgi:hypothetical protein
MGVKGWNVKQHLLVGGERSHSEALNQTLKLEAMMMAVRSPVKLWEVRAGAPTRLHSAATEGCAVFWHYEDIKHFRAYSLWSHDEKQCMRGIQLGFREQFKDDTKIKALLPSSSFSHFILSVLTKRNGDNLITKGWVGYKLCYVTIDIWSYVNIASARRRCSSDL